MATSNSANLVTEIAAAPVSFRRRAMNALVTGAAAGAVLLVLLPLGAIFVYLVYKGFGSLNWAFLTQIPKPVGEAGGGMANAIAGSAYILLIASAIGVPIGIGAGIYLSEYGRNRLGDLIRFTADVLNGVPSIIVGIVAYGLVVLSQGHFSALAGGVALAIMMIPTITRTTEEMLLLVPQAVREAAFGLGVSRWRTTLPITLRTATSGVITGIMLAFARVAGETAPLLFTAFGNQYWNWKMNQPTAALPLQIFTYAISPFDEWHREAWAGALILIILIVVSVSAVRIADLDVYNGTSAVQIRRRIGMVFQKPNPFPTMSIYDNVAAGLKLNGFRNRRKLDEIVQRSLTHSALWDEVKDIMHKKSGASLSGGQQQRLCIARALAVEPQVILMDEPCSALDPISTGKIEELIFQLKEHFTIVIVTHNMQQASRVAEFTGFFLLGKLIEFDKTEKIFTTPSDKRTEDYITGRFG